MEKTKKKYFIGIDAGTSKIKAVLIDINGYEIRSAYRDNVVLEVQKGWYQQDMERLWTNTLATLIEIAQGLDPNSVLGIGITGQGEGLWTVDKDGKAYAQSRLWSDSRAGVIVDKIKNSSLNQKVYNTTATPMFAGSTLSLMMWHSQNDPKFLDEAGYVLWCTDWLRSKLTGNVAAELSNASSSLINNSKMEWLDDILNDLNIAKYKRLFPKLLKSSEIAGTITQTVALATGLNKDTPVGAGALDIVAATTGVGAIKPGDISIVLGTTTAVSVVVSSKDIKPGEGDTRFFAHSIENTHLSIQFPMYGTPNLDWGIKEIFKIKDLKELDILVSELPPVPGGVIYHPYISPSGERSPFVNPNARASFFGLSTLTKNEYLIKAVYEGVGFSIMDCFRSIGTKVGNKISLAGGGAKSYAWAQMISDMTGKDVEIVRGEEFAAKGVCGILGVTLGVYKNIEDMKEKMCTTRAVFKPNFEKTKIYDSYYELYLEMRKKFQSLYDLRVKKLIEFNNQGY